jgi:hypothetical protein
MRPAVVHAMVGQQLIEPENKSSMLIIRMPRSQLITQVCRALLPSFVAVVPTAMAQIRLTSSVKHQRRGQRQADGFQNAT